MTDSAQISVVVPVKDEAGNVVPLAREIAQALQGERFEIIFVDDGSSDATIEELATLRALIPLRILAHGKNLGQSRALRTGVRASKAPMIVTLDGDGQNDPSDIPKLVVGFRQSVADPAFAMLAGERAKRQIG